MAYPGPLVAPFTYGQNFRSQEVRQHQRPNRFRFGAQDDATAMTIAGHVAAALDAQQTSLVKRIGEHNVGVNHPAGTRFSAHFLLRDTSGAVWRILLRNWKSGNPADYPTALFTGVASADTNIVPLSAAPSLPNSGGSVAVVTYTIVNKG